MSLVLRDLSLHNFGPYRGKQHIDLAPTAGAPVVLVHGENTLGKTQLFAALRWCLYGILKPQQTPVKAKREIAARMNLPAKREGESVLEVTINFDADGEPHRLTRRAVVDGSGADVTADLRIGPTVIPASGIDAEIGKLLHPQISEFFLFDAELLERFYERLASDHERDLIRTSIETVLGIPALQLAQHDVQDLGNDALQRQTRAAKNVGEAERISKRLKELASAVKSVERDRLDLKDQKHKAEIDLREVREQLKAVESLQADVRDQEMLEANLADGRREEESLRSDLKNLLTSGWRALANRRLQSALAVVQERNSAYQLNEKAIAAARMSVTVLKDQLRGGACPTCKQELPPPAPETEGLLVDAGQILQELLEGSGGGALDLDLERRLTSMIDKSTIPQYKKSYQRLGELGILQYERKQALDAISDRLKGHRSADIRALGQRAEGLENALRGIVQTQESNEREAQVIGAEQQKLARQLERLPGAKPEIAFEAAFFRYVDDLLRATIEDYRERVRAEVEADAEHMFLQLIRDPAGYGGLHIGSDYNIELLDTHKEERSTSEGGKQLLALSLIGALKRAAVRGGPVVLDSPLGRLDLEHRANVLKTWIPALGGQAVLLVQSGELTKQQASDLLGAQIGHAYEIVRPSGNPEHAVIEKVH